MPRRSLIPFALILTLAPLAARGDFTTTFENTGLAANSYNNNAGPSGAFAVDGNRFNNSYSHDPVYGDAWSGWALSSMTNTTDPSYSNQYSAITGSGARSSQTYAVGFTYGNNVTDPTHPNGTTISLAAGVAPVSIAITNTTYAYDAFKNGDPYGFAPAFGPNDFQRLDIAGFDAAGRQVGDVVFYLARNGSIVNTWTTVSLAALAGSTQLVFGLSSSENNAYGMATPAYFAADDFVTNIAPAAVPEPSSLVLGLAGLAMAGLAARRRATA